METQGLYGERSWKLTIVSRERTREVLPFVVDSLDSSRHKRTAEGTGNAQGTREVRARYARGAATKLMGANEINALETQRFLCDEEQLSQ